MKGTRFPPVLDRVSVNLTFLLLLSIEQVHAWTLNCADRRWSDQTSDRNSEQTPERTYWLGCCLHPPLRQHVRFTHAIKSFSFFLSQGKDCKTAASSYHNLPLFLQGYSRGSENAWDTQQLRPLSWGNDDDEHKKKNTFTLHWLGTGRMTLSAADKRMPTQPGTGPENLGCVPGTLSQEHIWPVWDTHLLHRASEGRPLHYKSMNYWLTKRRASKWLTIHSGRSMPLMPSLARHRSREANDAEGNW